jgi:hypothetical protein
MSFLNDDERDIEYSDEQAKRIAELEQTLTLERERGAKVAAALDDMIDLTGWVEDYDDKVEQRVNEAKTALAEYGAQGGE